MSSILLTRWQSLQHSMQSLVSSVLKLHSVPQHVAFIMDGNRRYAERNHMRKIEGHLFGYQRLIDALEWCFDLGIKCVSVYAFSLDNYKRSPQEVETLMQLAEEKLRHMIKEVAVLHKNGIQVRVIGDLSPAPPGVVAAAVEIMAATQHHTNGILNICFSYTSSREMVQALEAMEAQSDPDIDSHIDEYLYTRDCPPVDLLVRTSGETRLSDFLLWQSRHALLIFTHVLWPDFGYMDFISTIMTYQKHHATLYRIQQTVSMRQQAAREDVLNNPRAAPNQLKARLEQALQHTCTRPTLLLLRTKSAAADGGSPVSVTTPDPSSPSSGSEPERSLGSLTGMDSGEVMMMEVRQRRNVA